MDICMHILFWYGVLLGLLYNVKTSWVRQVQVTRFDNSCARRNISQTLNCPRRRSEKTKLIMNCTMTVNEDLPSLINVTFRIQRCGSLENLDSCEYFYQQQASRLCKDHETEMGNWRAFTKSFTPEWKCPLNKGRYHSINTTLDVAAFLLFPIDNWYWKVTIQSADSLTGRPIMCVAIDLHTTFRGK